jgi:hypothetical protein
MNLIKYICMISVMVMMQQISAHEAVIPRDNINVSYQILPVSGVVIDDFSNTPIAHAVVSVEWRMVPSNGSHIPPSTVRLVVKETSTGRDGRFNIPTQKFFTMRKRWQWDENNISSITVFKTGYYHKTINSATSSELAKKNPPGNVIKLTRIATNFMDYKGDPKWRNELVFMKNYMLSGIQGFYIQNPASSDRHFKAIRHIIEDNCRARWMTSEFKKTSCIAPKSKLGRLLGYGPPPPAIQEKINAEYKTKYYRIYHNYIKQGKTTILPPPNPYLLRANPLPHKKKDDH